MSPRGSDSSQRVCPVPTGTGGKTVPYERDHLQGSQESDFRLSPYKGGDEEGQVGVGPESHYTGHTTLHPKEFINDSWMEHDPCLELQPFRYN